jgi:hypothetical protein
MPPPPPGGPQPAPAHPYQNPYYTPSEVGPQPTVHRTPWILIAAVIAGLVLVMAGCGAGLALLGNKAGAGITTGIKPSPLPSPSPAGSPNPSASPTSSPSPISVSGGTVSNSNLSFTMPAGWAVVNKDSETITITDANGDGSVTIASGRSNPPQTAQQNKDTVDKVFTSKYPDTKNCPGSQTTTGDLNGASGIFWQLCFTLTSGGQSVTAGAPLFAGANHDGTVYYLVILFTSQDNMSAFITDTRPILASIQWSLK